MAAVVYELPHGATVRTLTITLAGMSPRADGLQACRVPLDAAGFTPAQNGGWADRPSYDCEAGAATAVVDGTTATFELGALQQGNLLAVALVPGPTDRAAIEKPADAALAVSSPAAASVAPADVGEPTPMHTFATEPAAAATVPSVSPPPIDAAPTVAAPQTGVVEPAAAIVSRAAAATDDQPMRTRVGGAIGFALLLVVLLFYSQGRGLLGARVGNT